MKSPKGRSSLLLFVSALAIVTCGGASAIQVVDLKSLCANRQVDITHGSQVRALAAQLESSTDEMLAECPSHLSVALIELDRLIGRPGDSGDVCSLAEVEKIREYSDKYIVTSLRDNNRNGHQPVLPKALKNFFLGYCLQVSKLCKKNMINSLLFDGHKLLDERDFKLINPWTSDSSAMSQIMNEPSDYDDMLLPRDLTSVLQGGDGERTSSGSQEDDKIFLKTATGHLISRVQAVCERRFKPIYEKLILPLIYLSNLGFNYQGQDLEREMKEMSANKEIHQWYRIVYLCESLNGIEIVEDPEDSAKTEGIDKKLVRVLSRDEAAELRAAARLLNRDDDRLSDIKTVVYEPEYGNQIEDEVLDLRDRNLMKLINSFASHKNELDRIRAKLMRKLAAFLFDKLKRGQFKLIHSLISGPEKPLEGADGPVESDNELLVKVFDEYVRQVTSGGESAVAGAGSTIGGVTMRYYHSAAVHGVTGLTAKMAKKTIDKAKVNRYFYYTIAIGLFIIGIVSLSVG